MRTRVADVNSFFTTLNALVVKILLVLCLWAIWNKDFIGERARDISQWTHYIDFLWILVTLIVYFMTAGIFWGVWFLIDRDDWWSKSAEVLVSFKDTTICKLPTDYIFQSAMSVMIVKVYTESVSGLLVPLHGCWLNHMHLANIQIWLDSAFEYCHKLHLVISPSILRRFPRS